MKKVWLAPHGRSVGLFSHGVVALDMKRGGSDAAKRAAGESAAEAVEDGMVVGLGTGSTTAYAIDAIGRQVDAGFDVTGVPTSFQARERAREAGIPLADLDEVTVDLAIDGADQVADGNLIKGGGAAHAREKVVDASADRFLVVVDPTKTASVLDHPVPLEVLPAARTTVAAAVRERGGDPDLRSAERKDGPVVTDNGNLVLDCDFGAIDSPADLARDLAATPGVVEHGLFVGLADEVHLGTADGVDVTDL
jgi:ribose 5-phosphate isomerase A